MLQRILYRWLVNFLGLYAAVTLISGITYSNRLRYLVLAALVLGIVNTLIRPVVIILSLPAIVLTVGLFTFVVNAFMLYLVTIVVPKVHIASFWSGLGAAIVIWLVNYLLNDLVQLQKGKPSEKSA